MSKNPFNEIPFQTGIRSRLGIRGIRGLKHYRQDPYMPSEAALPKEDILVFTETGNKNVWTNEGIEALLDSLTAATVAANATVYCITYETDTAGATVDTYAAPNYTECTLIDEATRPEWTGAAASGKARTNTANAATFTYSATKTIYGAGLVLGLNTKGNTAGNAKLLCYGKFGASRPVVDNDTIILDYEISGADS